MEPNELAAAVQPLVAGTRFTDIRWVDQTGSTNADLLARAAAGDPEGVVVLAEEQTAGRGRLGRTWSAPAGSSLLLSVLLRPALAPADAHLTTVAVALAAADACLEVAGVSATLKWPNDLVVESEGGTRKLAGILAESVVQADELEAVVVGLGCNVNWPIELPDDLADIATACNHLAGRDVDRVALLAALLVHLEHRCEQLASGPGRASLTRAYRERCSTLHRRVRVELADESIEGQAIDVTDSGHLVLEVDGEQGVVDRIEVVAGDVVHLRPA